MSQWTLLTNHAHVLVCLTRDPGLRIRDLAVRIGITERATQRIVSELESDGYLEVQKEGRRNLYKIHSELPMRHPVEAHAALHDLLRALS